MALRAQKRPDGFPTRNDITLISEAEHMIRECIRFVEGMGASKALTDAVTLLGQAKDRVADHLEGIE